MKKVPGGIKGRGRGRKASVARSPRNGGTERSSSRALSRVTEENARRRGSAQHRPATGQGYILEKKMPAPPPLRETSSVDDKEAEDRHWRSPSRTRPVPGLNG